MSIRRKRSETIDAQSYDDYLRLSETSSQHQHVPYISIATEKTRKDVSSSSTASANYWEDMDFNSQSSPVKKFERKASKRESQMLSSEEPKGRKQKQIMVIGANSSGRHRLINSLFENDEDQNQKSRSSFDLVVKERRDEENYLNVFKFWVKDACSEKSKHLMKIYYKSVSLFIFVYQVNDFSSFACLDRAMKEARDEAGSEGFSAVLIGLNPDSSQRKVSYQEGEELRQKYQLLDFIELSSISDDEESGLFDTLFA